MGNGYARTWLTQLMEQADSLCANHSAPVWVLTAVKGGVSRLAQRCVPLTERPMSRFEVLHMLNRPAEASGLPYYTCCPHFCAAAITTCLQNGGTMEHAQTIASNVRRDSEALI
jgi:hypothetical protein